MKKQKLYFSDLDEERAYTLDYIIDQMKYDNLIELEVSQAERETKSDYFYCKEFETVGEKNDFTCGKKWCDKYNPRNGRNGICKNWGYCYEPGKEFILKLDGKLIPVEYKHKDSSWNRDAGCFVCDECNKII